MHTSELYVKIRELAQENIVDVHTQWSDLVVLALEGMEDRATVAVPCRGDDILAALDRVKTAVVRTVNAGLTVGVFTNHIYGSHRETQAAVKRDFPTLIIDGIKFLSGFRADYTNN